METKQPTREPAMQAANALTIGFNGIATNLRGFGPLATELRVKVLDVRDGCVWVRTADLRDAGTPLVLDASKVRPEATETWRHRDGFVAFDATIPRCDDLTITAWVR